MNLNTCLACIYIQRGCFSYKAFVLTSLAPPALIQKTIHQHQESTYVLSSGGEHESPCASPSFMPSSTFLSVNYFPGLTCLPLRWPCDVKHGTKVEGIWSSDDPACWPVCLPAPEMREMRRRISSRWRWCAWKRHEERETSFIVKTPKRLQSISSPLLPRAQMPGDLLSDDLKFFFFYINSAAFTKEH